jgi:hypothetical protein
MSLEKLSKIIKKREHCDVNAIYSTYLKIVENLARNSGRSNCLGSEDRGFESFRGVHFTYTSHASWQCCCLDQCIVIVSF